MNQPIMEEWSRIIRYLNCTICTKLAECDIFIHDDYANKLTYEQKITSFNEIIWTEQSYKYYPIAIVPNDRLHSRDGLTGYYYVNIDVKSMYFNNIYHTYGRKFMFEQLIDQDSTERYRYDIGG